MNGLVYYLLGPGRHEEHENQRLIGSWDELHEQHNRLSPAELSELLAQPLALGRKGRQKTVWHTSLRNHATDRTLNDDEWAEVAREVLHYAGIAERDDPDGARWVVVRHADDHVHVVATLAGNETGRAIWPRHDYRRVREACRSVEERLELKRTGERGVGQPSTSRAELEQHDPKELPRDRLRTAVRTARAVSTTSDEFLRELAKAGVMVRPRMSVNNPEEITGYSVAWPKDTSGTGGEPIWFGGSKLASDLSWPKIVAGYEQQTAPKDDPKIEDAVELLDTAVENGQALLFGAEPVLAVGERVRALDRGNIGQVVEVDGDSYLVRFRSPDGVEADVQFGRADLEPLTPTKSTRDLDGVDFVEATERVARSISHIIEGPLGGPLTGTVDRFGRAAVEGRQLQRYQITDGGLSLKELAVMLQVLKPQRSDLNRILLGLVLLMEISERIRRVQGQAAQAETARNARHELEDYNQQHLPAGNGKNRQSGRPATTNRPSNGPKPTKTAQRRQRRHD